MENNTNQLNPMLCKKNCGFFGNAACDGYCSKCYKDHVKRQNSGSAAGRVTPTTGLSTTTPSNNQSQILINNNNISNNNNSNNNNNEIPVNTNTVQLNNEEQQTSVVQTKPSTLESTPVSANTTNSTSSSSSNTVNSTPVLQTQLSSSSVPIPIPSRQQSAVSNNNNSINTSNDNDIAMSVPNDLISTSLLSTSTSPIGAGTSVGDNSSGTSIGSEKKRRTRCVLETCRRKVGLTGFDCRCGGLYCWEHRYSDKHNCQFDYKELGQDQIRKNNPIVIGEKIQKI